MTEENNTVVRTAVPHWVQAIIWVFMAGLFITLFMGLMKARTPMAEVGKPIPNITFEFYKGYEHEGRTQVKLADLRGKVVMLNIWASWCKPCEQEASELEAMWRQYQSRDVVLIGIDYVDTPSGAYSYMQKFKITFPNAPDLQSAISSTLNRKMGVPETYFVDKKGVLRYIQIGQFTSVEQIQGILDPLLAE